MSRLSFLYIFKMIAFVKTGHFVRIFRMFKIVKFAQVLKVVNVDNVKI